MKNFNFGSCSVLHESKTRHKRFLVANINNFPDILNFFIKKVIRNAGYYSEQGKGRSANGNASLKL